MFGSRKNVSLIQEFTNCTCFQHSFSKVSLLCILFLNIRYDITADTVGTMKRSIQKETGFTKIQVMFRGVELKQDDVTLKAAGIRKGDILTVNVLSGDGKKRANDTTKKDATKEVNKVNPMSELMQGMGGKNSMEKMMQQMGMEGSLTPEKMEEQMKSVLSNPQITQMLDNPLVLEQSRQQIMNNPAMMQMFESMGMGDVFKDPKAYADHMNSVKEMLKDPMLLKSLGQSAPSSKKGDDFDQGDL
jgi:hypothetical protein